MRDATEADLPAIGRLRTAAGWDVHDWALRAVLVPPHARCLVVTNRDESVTGVGSGISYGDLGFVGNMVVAEEHRRHGVGATVLEAIIGFLAERGCTRLELFATPAGRPLYARHGFELSGPTAMAHVARLHVPNAGTALTIDDRPDADELGAYDAPRFGGDRRPLLEMMAADPERPLLAARDETGIRGYLWLRAEADRVGPFVADDQETAARLLRAAFDRLPDAETLRLNLPMANERGVAWLRGLGLAPEVWDGRMARGPQIERREDTIYANLVGALG
jgi:GNAT superfamily N-acetyltransferase